MVKFQQFDKNQTAQQIEWAVKHHIQLNQHNRTQQIQFMLWKLIRLNCNFFALCGRVLSKPKKKHSMARQTNGLSVRSILIAIFATELQILISTQVISFLLWPSLKIQIVARIWNQHKRSRFFCTLMAIFYIANMTSRLVLILSYKFYHFNDLYTISN